VETANRPDESSVVVTITGVDVEAAACCTRLSLLSLLSFDEDEKGILRMTPFAVPIHRREPLAFSAVIVTGKKREVIIDCCYDMTWSKTCIPVIRMNEKADLGDSIFPT
jgi:hypothetical protein